MGRRRSNLVPQEKEAAVVMVDNEVTVVSHVGFNIRSTKTTLARHKHRKLIGEARRVWARKKDKQQDTQPTKQTQYSHLAREVMDMHSGEALEQASNALDESTQQLADNCVICLTKTFFDHRDVSWCCSQTLCDMCTEDAQQAIREGEAQPCPNCLLDGRYAE